MPFGYLGTTVVVKPVSGIIKKPIYTYIFSGGYLGKEKVLIPANTNIKIIKVMKTSDGIDIGFANWKGLRPEAGWIKISEFVDAISTGTSISSSTTMITPIVPTFNIQSLIIPAVLVAGAGVLVVFAVLPMLRKRR